MQSLIFGLQTIVTEELTGTVSLMIVTEELTGTVSLMIVSEELL